MGRQPLWKLLIPSLVLQGRSPWLTHYITSWSWLQVVCAPRFSGCFLPAESCHRSKFFLAPNAKIVSWPSSECKLLMLQSFVGNLQFISVFKSPQTILDSFLFSKAENQGWASSHEWASWDIYNNIKSRSYPPCRSLVRCPPLVPFPAQTGLSGCPVWPLPSWPCGLLPSGSCVPRQ